MLVRPWRHCDLWDIQGVLARRLLQEVSLLNIVRNNGCLMTALNLSVSPLQHVIDLCNSVVLSLRRGLIYIARIIILYLSVWGWCCLLNSLLVLLLVLVRISIESGGFSPITAPASDTHAKRRDWEAERHNQHAQVKKLKLVGRLLHNRILLTHIPQFRRIDQYQPLRLSSDLKLSYVLLLLLLGYLG
jgi:hypothetical protein